MRLKQIKLVGFKSFVDPTVLSLEPQLIGIVGPNGCGKSNIIDAVRWVLGESSAKDLRGESMLDVIFNGSNARKPIGRAVVELLFDNLEGKLNREYANFSEVSIRREVDRDRQSEYYLNDKKCRKRDITDLFAGTGLLQNGYAIIGQGTVSKIIESKPEDLRAFVEEAADISIYKKRRHETELRMGHTEENLNRLKDIILEQDRLLEKLEKQSLIAKKYQNYQSQKHQIEVKLLTIKAIKFNNDLRKFNQSSKELGLELEKLITAKTKIFSELEQQKLLSTEKFDVFSGIQEKYYQLNMEISKLEQNLAYKKEQQLKYQQEGTIINAELTKISKEYEQDQKLQTELTTELSAIEIEYINTTNYKNDAEKIYTSAQAELQNIQAQFNNVQLNLQQAHNAVEQTKISIEQFENLSKELTFRIDKLSQENMHYDQDGLLTEILLVEKKLQAEEKILHNKHQELLLITDQSQQKKLTIKNLSIEKNELQSKIHKLHGNIGSLQTLQHAALEFNNLKLNWLNKNNIDQELFFNKLIIEDGWEIAVAVAFSEYLDGILISNEIKDLNLEILDSIKNFKLTLIEARSLDLNSKNNLAQNITESLQLDLRQNLISIRSKIKVNARIFDWLNNFFVADDLKYAIDHRQLLLPQECFVTKQGELVGLDWLIIDRVDHKQQVLLQSKELKALQANLTEIQGKLEQVNANIEVTEEELLNLEKSKNMMIEANQQQENSIRNLVAEVSAKRSKLDSIKNRAEKIILEIKEYRDKIEDLAAKEKNLRANLAMKIEVISSLSTEFQNLTDQKSKLQIELAPLLETNQLAAKKFHEISLYQQQLITKHQGVSEAKERSLEQLKILEAKNTKLILEATNNTSSLQPLELQLSNLLDSKLEQEDLLHAAQNDLNQINSDISNLEHQENNLNIDIEKLRSNLDQVKLEQQAATIRLEDLLLIAKNNSDFNLPELLKVINNNSENVDSNTAENILSPEELSDLQEKLDNLNKSINRLGPVNLAAIEEFNIESERKNYLNLQLQDLNTALETLKDAINKIDLETRKKFKITFEEINDNFKQLFPKLFGGGSAYLELTTNDLLTSGVSVFAQPPGKKNSSIYLLSGGEKALTAVALIFAIFKLNPAPFCILDEVDAPLDDANVIRLGELLISMSSKVQFIFVTHNKSTMKIANQLVGVTMKEPGVSRFVSVNVDEAVALID